MKKICLIMTALALMVISSGEVWAADKPEIADLTGRKVRVPADPERIVCLGPGCLRLIVYLQALEKVVGVEALERRPGGRPYYLAHRQTLDGLPVVSPGGPSAINKKPDLEAILKVKPQVVFVTYMEAGLADRVQALLNVPVVVLSYGRLAGFDELIYTSLRLAGKILNRSARAEAVINYIESGRADLLKRVDGIPESRKPSVFIGGIGYRGAHGLESTDSLYIPFNWLKAKNAGAKGSDPRGHVFLDKEKLLGLQPEVVFIDGGGLKLVRADYGKKTAFYKALKAFQQRRVHVLFPYNWYTTNVGTTLADAYAIGRVLHPGRFRDIDPVSKTDAIYTELVGRPVYKDMEKIYGPLGAEPGFIN